MVKLLAMRLLAFGMLCCCAVMPCIADSSVRSLKWSDLRPANSPKDIRSMLPVHNRLPNGIAPPAKQLDNSAPVVGALDGLLVRIPGYIVPLAMDNNQQIMEFLLVPYLGACIHVPPPPSNQIVYVKSQVAVNYNDTENPFWVTGKLHVAAMSSELAEAGYFMDGQALAPYTVEEN